jgi:hypothetical protein
MVSVSKPRLFLFLFWQDGISAVFHHLIGVFEKQSDYLFQSPPEYVELCKYDLVFFVHPWFDDLNACPLCLICISLITLIKLCVNQCLSILRYNLTLVAKLLHKFSIVFVEIMSNVCKSISLSSSIISGHRATSECFRIAKSNLMGLISSEFVGQWNKILQFCTIQSNVCCNLWYGAMSCWKIQLKNLYSRSDLLTKPSSVIFSTYLFELIVHSTNRSLLLYLILMISNIMIDGWRF